MDFVERHALVVFPENRKHPFEKIVAMVRFGYKNAAQKRGNWRLKSSMQRF